MCARDLSPANKEQGDGRTNMDENRARLCELTLLARESQSHTVLSHVSHNLVSTFYLSIVDMYREYVNGTICTHVTLLFLLTLVHIEYRTSDL